MDEIEILMTRLRLSLDGIEDENNGTWHSALRAEANRSFETIEDLKIALTRLLDDVKEV